MPPEFLNLIGGKWSAATSGRTIESVNPADTGDTVGLVPASGKGEVDRAVAAARGAYAGWRLTPAPKRGEILFRTAELLLKHKNELARVVTREMGKILPEGMGDVQEAIDMAYYMAGEGRRLSGETVPSELFAKDCKSLRVPIGVFALITPWNFPTAIPAWKIFPCLIAGNTAVFKPSSYTPIAAGRLVELIAESGLPPGVLNLVHGTGDETGEYLATHPGIDGVSFTGSSAVGERLAKLCSGLEKEISCEMGGKNPIIIMDDARLDLAVEGALWGAFGTSGQRCTAASRLIVHERVYDRFLEMFLDTARRLKIGSGLDPVTHMGPVINEAQMKKVLGYIEIGKKEGAKLVLGGKRLSEGDYAKGFFIEPTVFADVDPEMRIAQEEIFGPVASVIKAKDLKDAIRIANGVQYGLSSSIYTQDVNSSAIAERDLDAGIVYINAPTIGAEVQLPFGGTKRSGLGRKEAGGRGGSLDMFTKWKVIYRDYSGRLQKAQIDKE
ncbi:MAG: aldehyde dehydrogenase family protein [Deltaproteobacteria bacterium]|nr:aldehyde dehydrogenase family protein [Deltaproteobacteria bacterium]MBZ0219668.1 aldehyde dehydrogenase family protein [Deltaproteobacteria bacterium]